MILRTQRLFLLFMICAIAMPKASLCDGSESKNGDSGINPSSILTTAAVTAVTYVLITYGDSGVRRAWYYCTNQESPEQRQQRIDKEKAEHRKRILINQRSLILQADENMRERLLATGGITAEENARLLRQHGERLIKNSSIQNKQLTLAELQEQQESEPTEDADLLKLQVKADGSVALKDIDGKAR